MLLIYHVCYIVIVLTLARMSSPWSKDRLQSLWIGGIPQGEHTNKPKVVNAYITADAINVSTRNI